MLTSLVSQWKGRVLVSEDDHNNTDLRIDTSSIDMVPYAFSSTHESETAPGES